MKANKSHTKLSPILQISEKIIVIVIASMETPLETRPEVLEKLNVAASKTSNLNLMRELPIPTR